jgi:hypothetical protein
MRDKTLVSFGDSWPAGVGLGYQDKTYAQLLATKLDCNLIDCSDPATSVHHMVVAFKKFLEQDYKPDNKYIALFFITAQERQLCFDDNNKPMEMHTGSDFCKNYYKEIYTNKLGEFNLNTTLLALQSLADKYHVDDRYLLGWQYPTLWKEIDLGRFYKEATVNCVNLLGAYPQLSDAGTAMDLDKNDTNNFIPGDGHPSSQGHQLIADALYEWIKTDAR